ncbi:MAG TPA: hypothetical protein VGH27_02645 [Streptosporangiaceae bacterium]|jgi:hypothetical protein
MNPGRDEAEAPRRLRKTCEVRAVQGLAGVIRPLQSGDVNLYLLYVFGVILLAYLLGAV